MPLGAFPLGSGSKFSLAPCVRLRSLTLHLHSTGARTKGSNNVARLFGTDGVRGLANKDITAELALDLSVAAAHVLAEVGEFNGHRPVAVVGRDPRASGEFLAAAAMAGLASAGVDVRDAGVLPTPAIAYLVGEQRRRPRRHAVRVAQPDARQRDQVLRPRWAQARRRLEDAIEQRLGEHGSARPARTSAGSAALADGADRYVAHLLSVLPHRLDGLQVVLDCAHGAASVVAPQAFRRGRRRGRRDRRRARRAQHQRRLRLDAPGPAAGGGRRASAPTSASPSTVTPTAASRSTPPARSSTATRSWPSWRWRMKEQGAPARHPRRHRHVQPRADPGDGARRHQRSADRGGRPLCARGDAGRRLLPRRRAVGPCRHARPRRPPATAR